MAFVVSSGQVQAIETAPTAYYSITPTTGLVQLSPLLAMTYEQLYRAQPEVRTVIGFLARNIAQLGLSPYRRVSATDRVKVPDHPLGRLLSRPVPGSKWTQFRLISWTIHEMCLFDNAFWLKVRVAGGLQGVLPIPRRFVSPLGSDAFFPDKYLILGNHGHMEVDAGNVVHFHGYNPEDVRIGVPPMETLRRILAEEYAATTYREQMWRNGARVAGYIRRPKDAPRWGDEARTRFRNDWQSQYAGDGPATGGTPVLEDGMEFTGSGVSPRDAQYVESRKLTREEVAVAYFVPPVMLGIMEGVNLSSIGELHQMLYQDTLAPWIAQLAQDIECQLLPDLDSDPAVYVEFNLAEKLRGNFEAQAAALQASVGGPWMTREEARSMYNLPHIDGAQELITPLNVVTGGLASPRDTAPNNPSNEESNGQPPGPKPASRPATPRKARPVKGRAAPMAEMMRGYFSRQAAAVLSRMGAAKAKANPTTLAELWDGDRWDEELTDDLAPLASGTAAAAGESLLAALGISGASYDQARTAGWITAHCSGVASGINGTTRAELETALTKEDPGAAVRQMFDELASARAEQIAQTEATAMTGFGTEEAMTQNELPGTKTWITGGSPRASHAAMAGQTVAMGETFSNGARWPGDSLLDNAERAGCNCELDVEAAP